MMIAIIKTGGKQYAVKAGQILKVEKLVGKQGDNISISDVLAVSDSSFNEIGNPILKDTNVKAKILKQIRDKKIIVFKKRKRQNYRLTQGHRQHLTLLKIESIEHNGKKISAPKVVKSAKEDTVINKPIKKVVKTRDKKLAKKALPKKVGKKAVAKKSSTKKTPKNKKG